MNVLILDGVTRWLDGAFLWKFSRKRIWFLECFVSFLGVTYLCNENEGIRENNL